MAELCRIVILGRRVNSKAPGRSMRHHRSHMGRYFVTMKISEADSGNPALLLEGLTAVLREASVPTLESLLDLKAQQSREVIGGYLSGRQSVVLIMEADSEEQVFEVLKKLPAGTRRTPRSPVCAS
jgi:hypothetical protein